MIRRILAAGTWDDGQGYPRARGLLAALRARGVDVAEVRADAPSRGVAKVRLAASPWRWPGYWLGTRLARRRLRLAFAAAVEKSPPDAVLVPYPGHLAVRWVRSWFRGPLILDLFLSAYGTAIEDRRMFGPRSIPARLLRRLDRSACKAADLVLLDTPQHAELVARLLAPHRAEVDWVPISDPHEAGIEVWPLPARAEGRPLEVLFFGTGVPLHGLRTLIEAVAECRREVRLTLVGGRASERELAVESLGDDVELGPEFAPLADLRRLIERSHLVAGIFGTSQKAASVVPFKVVHALAQGRPVLTADTPCARAMLEPGSDCLVCPAGDARALAERLRWAASHRDELSAVAGRARARYDSTFSLAAAGARFVEALDRRFGGEPTAPIRPAAAVQEVVDAAR